MHRFQLLVMLTCMVLNFASAQDCIPKYLDISSACEDGKEILFSGGRPDTLCDRTYLRLKSSIDHPTKSCYVVIPPGTTVSMETMETSSDWSMPGATTCFYRRESVQVAKVLPGGDTSLKYCLAGKFTVECDDYGCYPEQTYYFTPLMANREEYIQDYHLIFSLDEPESFVNLLLTRSQSLLLDEDEFRCGANHYVHSSMACDGIPVCPALTTSYPITSYPDESPCQMEPWIPTTYPWYPAPDTDSDDRLVEWWAAIGCAFLIVGTGILLECAVLLCLICSFGREFSGTDRILLIYGLILNTGLIISGSVLVGIAPTGPDVSLFVAMIMGGLFLVFLHVTAYSSEARKRRLAASAQAIRQQTQSVIDSNLAPYNAPPPSYPNSGYEADVFAPPSYEDAVQMEEEEQRNKEGRADHSGNTTVD